MIVEKLCFYFLFFVGRDSVLIIDPFDIGLEDILVP